ARRVCSIFNGAVQVARGRGGGTLTIPELDREQSARMEGLRADHDLAEPVVEVVRHLQQVGRRVRDALLHGIVRAAAGYRDLAVRIANEVRDALHVGLGLPFEENRKAPGAPRLDARLDPAVRRARVAVLRVPVVAGLPHLDSAVPAHRLGRVGGRRQSGDEEKRQNRKTGADDDHGAETVQVTPWSGKPRGSVATSTVQVKSAAVGGTATFMQSKKLIVNRFPGVSGCEVPAITSRSA